MDEHVKEREESKGTPKHLAQASGRVKGGFAPPELERLRKEQAWSGCEPALPSEMCHLQDAHKKSKWRWTEESGYRGSDVVQRGTVIRGVIGCRWRLKHLEDRMGSAKQKVWKEKRHEG